MTSFAHTLTTQGRSVAAGLRRRSTAIAIALLVAGLQPAAGLAAQVAPDNLGASLVDGYIQPATQRFSRSATEMKAALTQYCDDRKADDGEQVRARFGELVQAWAGVEFLRFGPLVEDNRFERIFFWPDPRGTVQRRTQGALAKGDDALLQAGALRADSVAVQGLPSLEYALFGGKQALFAEAPATGAEADYRCAYATAVAANVAGLAGEIEQAWGAQGEMARQFREPGPDNPLYRNATEVTAEAIKAMSSGLYYIRDAKLLAALGGSPEKAKQTSAPLWRSGQTLPAVAAGILAVGEFYRAADLADTFEEKDRWLAAVVTSGTERMAARLEPLTMPLDEALVQPEPRRALVSTVVELNEMKEMIDGQIASALGVRVGFNALDGD